MNERDYEKRITDWLSCGESKLSPRDVASLAAHLAAPPTPYLDHVYNGPAVRLELEGRPGLLGYEEHLTGAFAVLYRDERCAIIGNGEHGTGAKRAEERGPGEGRWLVTMLDRLVKP